MNIYKLSQQENCGWDTFDSIVVCANSPEDAKNINPHGKSFDSDSSIPYNDWAKSKEAIKCELIGKANKDVERGVILASFNAG